jgi:hypothetical protein
MGALIPNPQTTITGLQFIQKNDNKVLREQNALDAFLNGQIPDFLRTFAPINIKDSKNDLTYLVMKDYLSIGTDSDYIRMPMNPLTAAKIAQKYDCSLPTRKMVLDIYNRSNKISALPQGAPYTNMDSSIRYLEHNTSIQKYVIDKTKLIAGHKKDVVLTNKLAPNNPNKKVAIYGWFLNGKPIQNLNPLSHDWYYQDYSHGIRLIANDVILNNQVRRIQDIFGDPDLSYLVSDEGKLSFLSY